MSYNSIKKQVNSGKMPIWSGNWWSEQYLSFFAKGTVAVNLPDDVTSLNNTEVDIQMKYTGIYRNGAVEDLKSTATYNEGKIDMTVKYNQGLLSYSVSTIGDSLEGKYSLTNPYDKGSVQLRKGAENTEGSGCVIS